MFSVIVCSSESSYSPPYGLTLTPESESPIFGLLTLGLSLLETPPPWRVTISIPKMYMGNTALQQGWHIYYGKTWLHLSLWHYCNNSGLEITIGFPRQVLGFLSENPSLRLSVGLIIPGFRKPRSGNPGPSIRFRSPFLGVRDIQKPSNFERCNLSA